MAETLDVQVQRLLQESRAAHDQAKLLRTQKQRTEATATLVRARDLRAEAHALDPAHAAPAWAAEQPPHEAMVAFYLRQLGSA